MKAIERVLKVGDIIQVNGWVMLKGIEGKLKVSKVDEISYWFTKPKGKKAVSRHLIHDIEGKIDCNSDINFIEIVK